MNAEVVTVGSEILTGQVVDTNAAFIGRRLEEIGIFPEWITSVRDTVEDVTQALRTASQRARVVVVTGGLGPTHDDITKHAFAGLFNRPLRLDKNVLQHVRQRFASRGLKMPQINVNQALVPEKVTVLPNEWGTAPGLYLKTDGSHVFLLPGVPREMEGIFDKHVAAILEGVRPAGVIVHRTLRTTGISESALFEQLSTLGNQDHLSFLPQGTGVDVRITIKRDDQGEAEAQLAAIEQQIRDRLGAFIYGVDSETLEQVVGELLRSLGWRIAVAESCTGGLISCRLTDVPGSSDYFEQGVVAYSNRSKMQELGVPEGTLREHGAVSAQIASAMASCVRKLAGTQIGLAVTGIAGPTGATPNKPVGLVFVGVSTQTKTRAQRFQFSFSGDRLAIKQRTAQAALELVRQRLLRETPK